MSRRIERYTIFKSLHSGLDYLGTPEDPLILLNVVPSEGLTMFSLHAWIDLPNQKIVDIPLEGSEDSEETYNQKLAKNERENASFLLYFSIWSPDLSQWDYWLSYALINRGAPQTPDYFADIQNSMSAFNLGPGFKIGVSIVNNDGSDGAFLGENDIINIYGDAVAEIEVAS